MAQLFPLEKNLEISEDTRPLTQTGSIQVFVQLAEPNLFVQGFDSNEFKDRPPTLLRGSLVLRIIKPLKLKSISLTFKGIARTEWPEGIPPKRQDFMEENILVEHTWPFFNVQDSVNSGADIVKTADGLMSTEDVSSLNLDTASIRSTSNARSVFKRVTSPSPNRSRSGSMKKNNLEPITSNNEPFVFSPGDYFYNFEHPIPASSPESVDATFGSINYSLNVSIERTGAFKSNIFSTLPIRIIRSPSDESIEDSEPIAISRDWEDKLHYDIIIASKAIILNAYLPIAFKLTPLAKIKLHRIRVYLTENIEYYCRNKKVHRMEPTKKYLMLEMKAPPPKNLPEDADPKAKKMGNLLTSDGEDLTAREFEFQVFIPQKLNNRQNLHPNTAYTNIKSHHWIKICLRLSRLQDGKPKHYEISIDSPIHVLDPLCSHANTLLPAYGLDLNPNTIMNHESNIYFPKDLIPSSPQLSPEVEPVAFQNVSNSISQVFHQGRSRSSSSVNSLRRRGSASLSQPPQVLHDSETTTSNIYKPDFDTLSTGLTSPQAIPISPVVSPSMRPIHLIRRPSFEPPPFDADISPPPLMREIRSVSPNPTSSTQQQAPPSPLLQQPQQQQQVADVIGVNGILMGDVGLGSGIDSMIQSPPKDPPTYEATLQKDKLQSPQSPYTIDERGISLSRSIPEIQLTTASSDTASPHGHRHTNSSTQHGIDPNDGIETEGDIASSFSFKGINGHHGNLEMPSSVLRSTSPAGQRLRSENREGRSGMATRENSRRGSFVSMNSNGAGSGSNDVISNLNHDNSEVPEERSSLERLRRTLGGIGSGNSIDNTTAAAAAATTPTSSTKESTHPPTNPPNYDFFETRGRENKDTEDKEGEEEERTGRSRISSNSSVSPHGASSLRDYDGIDDENPTGGMEPLLQSMTSASFDQQSYASFEGPYDPFRGRFESRESLIRREPSSVDITALYTDNHPGILKDLENLSVGNRNGSIISGGNSTRRSGSLQGTGSGSGSGTGTSTGTGAGTSVLATLDDNAVIEEDEEVVDTPKHIGETADTLSGSNLRRVV